MVMADTARNRGFDAAASLGRGNPGSGRNCGAVRRWRLARWIGVNWRTFLRIYNDLEYAYEPVEAFYEFVLGVGNSSQPLANAECPYSVLGLGKGASTSQVRSAYRALAAKFHPDRQAGGELEAFAEEFKRVIRAYDQIKRTGLADNGEIASYASLGGTGRNSLSEPINMTSQSMQAKLLVDVQVAVRPLDSEIINRFLARSCAKQATTVIV